MTSYGVATYTIKAGKTKTIRVKLTAAGRKALKRKGKLRVTVAVTAGTSSWSLNLTLKVLMQARGSLLDEQVLPHAQDARGLQLSWSAMTARCRSRTTAGRPPCCAAASRHAFSIDVQDRDPQELMARLTGNYKRGNERMGQDDPRNRGR